MKQLRLNEPFLSLSTLLPQYFENEFKIRPVNVPMTIRREKDEETQCRKVFLGSNKDNISRFSGTGRESLIEYELNLTCC